MASQVSAANLGGVTDGRLTVETDAIGSKEYNSSVAYQGQRPLPIKLFDPSVTFEEYVYYAEQERAFERNIAPKKSAVSGFWTVAVGRIYKRKEREQELAIRTGSMSHGDAKTTGSVSNGDTKTPQGASGASETSPFSVISENEWHTAARAARTATWGAVFYLITTDILGPFSVPYAFAQLGYGPGVALYTIFALLAGLSGYQLWQQFLGLDSSRYPVTGYGDLAFRIYGSFARHVVNVFQSLQFFLNVTILIVSSGQALAQLASGVDGTGCLCFVVAEVIFMALGMLLGQIRTLQRFSHLANIAIWLNVFIIFMTMGIAANSSPNWDAAIAAGQAQYAGEPIVHTGGIPPGKGLVDNVNGLMQAVYSYGGATLYMNLMAEMRRPMDFWKALIVADVFIFLCYLIFGVVVYSYQGQASYNPAYQGIDPYTWQTVGNVFTLITAVIAAVLYGNIGIKVLYANVGRELFKMPALESRVGKLLWIGIVPLYWALAFIIAAAVPQVSGLSGFVGGAFILQFSYTFPPLLMLGYNVLRDSMPAEGAFDPVTGVTNRDRGFSRIWRGYKVRLLVNTWNLIYGLGALVTAVLGIYASIAYMINFFGTTKVTAFTCISPAGSGCSPPQASGTV